MRFSTQVVSAALALSSFALASPLPGDSDKRSFVERDGTNYTVFEHAATGAKLEFVTNSGICETTKGVNQYSGYLSVGQNMNMCDLSHSSSFRSLPNSIGGFGSSRLEIPPPQLLSQYGSTVDRDAAQ